MKVPGSIRAAGSVAAGSVWVTLTVGLLMMPEGAPVQMPSKLPTGSGGLPVADHRSPLTADNAGRFTAGLDSNLALGGSHESNPLTFWDGAFSLRQKPAAVGVGPLDVPIRQTTTVVVDRRVGERDRFLAPPGGRVRSQLGSVGPPPPGRLRPLDTFGSGDRLVVLEFAAIGDVGNPPKTGTLYAWNPGSVGYAYRLQTTEMSYGDAAKIVALAGLNITIQPAVTGVVDQNDRPCSKILPVEAALIVNALNALAGYPPAYNISGSYPRYIWDVWAAGSSWVDAGTTNRLRHSAAFYYLPSTDEYFKAAQWHQATLQWLNYGQGKNTKPGAINGFYGGDGSPGTSVFFQALDERHPEWNYASVDNGLELHSGNLSEVNLTTSGGQITGVEFMSRLSGYAVTNNTSVAWTVTQGQRRDGAAVVSAYQTNRVVAQFEIVNAGSGYNGSTPHLTNGIGTVTIGDSTVTVRVWARGGAVLGLFPLRGNFKAEDTNTVAAVVQSGGNGATCRPTRYTSVHVPAVFSVVTPGSGYTNGLATIRTSRQANIWQASQPWQGAAPVRMAGGLSPYGVMGLDGNVHEYTDTERDGVTDGVADGPYGDYLLFFSSYWNIDAQPSGLAVEYKPRNETISSSDSTYESGFRVMSRTP